MDRRRLAESAARTALAVAALACFGRLWAAGDPPAPKVDPAGTVSAKGAALEDEAAPRAPTAIAVLGFGGESNENIGPEKLNFMFEQKLKAIPDFVLIEPMSVKESVRRNKIDPATVDDATVAKLMAAEFGGRFCLRGEIHPRDKKVSLKVRIIETLPGNSADAPKFNVWFDRSFELEHYRDAPGVVRQIALDLAGLKEKPDRVVDQVTGPNIVPNGDFEKADKTGRFAEGWGPFDGLSVFWVDEPGRGKVIRVETDMPVSQWKQWRDAIAAGAKIEDAPQKLPRSADGYETVGGNNGVAVWGPIVPIQPGQAYRISFDCKGPGGKVFVKGYAVFVAKELTQNREVWNAFKNMRPKNPNEWEHYERTIHPTERVKSTKSLQVMLFPYWPPATYYFDNVKIEPVTEKEVEAQRAFEK